MSIVNIIKHYQRSIEKYSEDENRILHCIEKLNNLPVEVAHLQETGVGRTINALRKYKGQVGDAARGLVAKWRAMVAAESESEGDADNVDNISNHSEDNSMTIDEENPQTSDNEYEESVQQDNTESEHEEIENDKPVQDERKKHRKHEKHRDSSHKRHKSKHSKEHRHNDESKSSKKSHKRKQEEPHHTNHKSDKNKRIETEDSEHESPKSYVEEKPKKDIKPKSNETSSPTCSYTNNDEKKSDKHSNSKRKHSDHSTKDKDKHKHKSKHKESESKSRHSESEKHSKKHSEKSDKKAKRSKSETSDQPRQSNSKNSKFDLNIIDHDDDDGGINSSSGASFAEALGMSSSPKKKKISKPDFIKPKTPEVASPKENGIDLLAPNTKLPHLDLELTLPTISPNYHPSTSSSLYVESLLNSSNNKPKFRSQEESLSIAISSKNQRTKVYSGNKSAWGYVPTLFDLCIRVLQDNIDALAYTGGVPYHILLPVLERASPEQLFELENHNPYFLDDTEPLWEQHCKREFRNKSRMEMETWREAYVRFLNERDEKLRALTANIKQSIDKSLPVRQTKLAYVDSMAKPPRNVIRKQAKFGTGSNAKPATTPSARAAALTQPGVMSNIAVPNPGARASTYAHSSSSSVSKPKKAPLMQKTLALIKSTNRYRR